MSCLLGCGPALSFQVMGRLLLDTAQSVGSVMVGGAQVSLASPQGRELGPPETPLECPSPLFMPVETGSHLGGRHATQPGPHTSWGKRFGVAPGMFGGFWLMGETRNQIPKPWSSLGSSDKIPHSAFHVVEDRMGRCGRPGARPRFPLMWQTPRFHAGLGHSLRSHANTAPWPPG